VHESYFNGAHNATSVVEVESVELNPTIPSNTFTVSLPDGIPVADGVTKEIRITGGPASRSALAAKAVEQGQQQLEQAVQVAEHVLPSATASAGGNGLTLSLGVGAASLVIIGIAFWLRRKS
jgi:hypothetical protein